MTNVDTALAFITFLRTHDNAAGVRNLIWFGSDKDSTYGIYETGDVTDALLNTIEDARSKAAEPPLEGEDEDPKEPQELNKVLCLSVYDAGETAASTQGVRIQTVAVRIYDRRRGYSGIRAVRQALIAAAKTIETLSLASGTTQGRGMLAFNYHSRSGLRRDRTYAVWYEEVVFVARIMDFNEIA